MTVALLPPLSGGLSNDGLTPLTTGPRYARTVDMSRWHRPRNGIRWPNDHIHYGFWCGAGGVHVRPGQYTVLLADRVPADDPVCGTCEGRALGAGQDDIPDGVPQLRFDPRYMEPPAKCPGSRDRELWTPIEDGHHSVGRCLACQAITAIRVVGRGYNAWGAGPINHPPGPGLYAPCPWHAWQRPTKSRDGTAAVCGCGWLPTEPQPAPPEGK
jgi:hypothetical protein